MTSPIRCSGILKKSRNRPRFTLGELAERLGGVVEGDDQVVIASVAAIETAAAHDISFVANARYRKYLESTDAAAVILGPGVPCNRMPVLRHENPYLAFAQAVDLLYPAQALLPAGVHASAVVEDGVSIDPSVAVGPLCHVAAGATIGEQSQLISSVYVGRDVSVGNNCLFYPGVKIMDGCRIGNDVIVHSSAVIGSDGFGFAAAAEGFKKIRQIGWVEIGDAVEIGSNTSIDRGALGPTRIGRGTKIDNLVQIAHNVEIGDNSIVVSQVGISGSTKVGRGVTLAGQVGIVGHVDIGNGVKVGAQSGVARSVPAGQTVFGSPARDITETMRIQAALTRLPDLLRRVRSLEEKLSG